MPIIRPTGRPFAQRAKELEDAKRQHLEPQELKNLWAALGEDPFWLGYFKLQYHFGCRTSEVAIVLKEDVSFKDKQIAIRRLKKSQKKKRTPDGYDVGTYPMPQVLIDVLRAVPHATKENPWFFGSRQRAGGGERFERMASIRITDGGWRSVSRSSAQQKFLSVAKEAGIPKHLRHTHVLRHTRATLLFANGATEAQVQYLLAHSSPTITRRYIGWADSLKKRADVAALLEDEE